MLLELHRKILVIKLTYQKEDPPYKPERSSRIKLAALATEKTWQLVKE
jgi:hypothetical protein